VLFTDREFAPIVSKALQLAKGKPLVIDVDDALFEAGEALGSMEYEAFLAEGDANYEWTVPPDEWDAIALNYTSGTTGNPKGVVYHYRGAYLNAVNNILDWSMPKHPVYLWTLPMFHCNGWCFNWTIAAAAGTNVCLRKVEAKAILDDPHHKVTHCGAIVHSMLLNAPPGWKESRPRGPLPGGRRPRRGDRGHGEMGFDITHVYGLTETYGPPRCAQASRMGISARGRCGATA
jgi:fatty-acyl-CoA synthase